MCESTFVPLEIIRDLLASQNKPEPTQEEYIKIRKEIEKDDEINQIVGIIEDSNNFEKNLRKNAEKQLKYVGDRVKEKLVNKYIESDAWRIPKEQTPQEKTRRQMQNIETYLVGYYATWIIDIGLKSGLLSAIAEANHVMSPEDLSRHLGLALPYIQIWCRAAYAFELLEIEDKQGDLSKIYQEVEQIEPSKGYRLAENIQEVLLNPTNPNNMRFDIEFGTALHQDFHRFPTYLDTGETWPLATHTPLLQRLYIEATLDDYPVLTQVILPEMVARMTPSRLDRLRLPENGEPLCILDVGTGAGFGLIYYANYYARTFSQVEVTGLDKNLVYVEEAKRTISRNLISQKSRIEVRQLDVNALADHEKYDLIIINLALHEIGISDYPNVFERLHTALKPGGVVVISEYHFPDLAIEPTYRYPGYQLLLSQILHLALVGNVLVPAQEVIELLQRANFAPQELVHHPTEERQIIVAKKVPSSSSS